MACSESIRHPIIVLQDGKAKSKMSFSNPNRRIVKKTLVDGCEITEGLRCDFLLISQNTEYYVELKGKQVAHACDQLASSIQKLTNDIKAVKYSFAISSACPLTTTEIQVQKAKFKKSFNSALIIKNVYCEYCLD